MTRTHCWLSGLALCLAHGGALAQAPASDDWTSSPESYLCKSRSEVREIRTYWRDTSGQSADALSCRVDYLKSGTVQTLWSAHHGRAYCDQKAADLVTKLTASGEFSCDRLRLGAQAR